MPEQTLNRRLRITTELTFSGAKPKDVILRRLQRDVADAITHVLKDEGFPHLSHDVPPDWVGVRWVEREPMGESVAVTPEVAEVIHVLAEGIPVIQSFEDDDASKLAILAMAERIAAGRIGPACGAIEPNQSAANAAVCDKHAGHVWHSGFAQGPAASERPGRHRWLLVGDAE